MRDAGPLADVPAPAAPESSMQRPFSPLSLLLAAALALAGCEVATPVVPLEITQVSFSQVVVLPGETITMSVTTAGPESPSFEWTADAGELAVPAAATTEWIAPGTEQLVAVSVTVTAGDQRVVHNTDLVVGYGIDHDGDGFTLREGDCDDTNNAIYPGAPDTQDGLDNDCDGIADEGSPEADDDGDGFSDFEGDCDDGDDAVHPGAPEVQNGIDDDCDNVVDEGTVVFDDDGDGFCEDDDSCLGGAEPGDCNDNSSAVNPDAPETLDNIDNDCDGDVDEGTAAFDDDGDGFTELQGDCNDDPDNGGDLSFPGGVELSDGIDNDCDGLIDEDFLVDGDDDGWSLLAGDCDDTSFYVYPGAPEFADGVDNDCDGLIDNDIDTTDDDGDGLSEADGDCDDTNPSVFPGALEIPDSPLELDNDCDGYFVANPPVAVAQVAAIAGCINGIDDDGDGWIDGDDPDCGGGLEEVGTSFLACNDGLDNDGDGQIDGADDQCDQGWDADEASGDPDDCADGLDGDGDGWVDGQDPECRVAPFNEAGVTGITECSDGVDSDGDGDVDAEDAECDDGFDGSESSDAADDCSDGVDSDGDGWADAADPDCLFPPFDETGVGSDPCNDGIDNDGDGLPDGQDVGCSSALDQDETADTCSSVSLDGSASSDPDGDALIYYWFFAFQPISSDLTSDDIGGGETVSATFTPDVAGTWTAGLIVSDGFFNSEPAYVSMDILPGSCP